MNQLNVVHSNMINQKKKKKSLMSNFFNKNVNVKKF